MNEKNIESLIKKHKIKTLSCGAGSALFGLISGVLTYSFVGVIMDMYAHKITITNEEFFSLDGGLMDLMAANAVALGLAWGLYDCAQDSYNKIKDLKRKRKNKGYF
jgi:hypothetical protein